MSTASAAIPAVPIAAAPGAGAGPLPLTPEAAGEAAAGMLRIISSFWLQRAVYAAAKLGIADVVARGPATADEVAAEVGAHGPSTYRLLRALASAGIFAEDEHGRFGLTPLATTLQSGVPHSLRSLAIAELGQEHYAAWEDVIHSVRTGETAFGHRYGTTIWEHYARTPDDGRVFSEAMLGLTHATNHAVLEACDFGDPMRVVDVGGAFGGLLAGVLARHPGASGVLFDLPGVVGGAGEYLAAQGIGGRVEVAAGDFFRSVPAGGDLYLLKLVLHDWDDERALAILRNVRAAAEDGARLAVVEMVFGRDNEPAPGKLMDLNMLVMTGGRERSVPEYRDLLASAGFRLERVVPTPSPVSVLEAVAV